MKKNYGASFLNNIREKMQQKRESQQSMDDSAIESGFNDPNNNMQQNDPTMNPMSNGTGSARPNFGQFAQNVLSKVSGGLGLKHAMGGYGTKQAMQQQMQQPFSPDQEQANAALMNMNASGASISGVKPKKVAKAKAKAYADKHGIRGSARKEMIKEAKKGRSFDPETNSQSKKVAESKKEVDFGGAPMNGGPGKRKKKDIPKAKQSVKDIPTATKTKGRLKQSVKDIKKPLQKASYRPAKKS